MEQNKHRLGTIAALAAGGVLCWLAVRYLLGWLWPLVCAGILAAVIRRPVEYLAGRRILKKHTAAILLTLVCLAAAVTLVWLAVSLGVYLVDRAAEYLPGLLERAQAGADTALAALQRLQARLPPALGRTPLFTAEALTGWLTPEKLGLGALVQKVTRMAVDLPELAFCLVFVLAATYYLTVDGREIGAFVHRQLSPRQSLALVRLREDLGRSLLGWLRAQAVLISVTFGLVLVSYYGLGLAEPFLLALLTAAVDALPVLGAGAVLMPWGIWCLVTGSTGRGAALLVLWVGNMTLRNLLEPKLVSSGLGLHPFVTLLCLFLGFRMVGLAGMFLLPVAVLALTRLQQWDYLKLWK